MLNLFNDLDKGAVFSPCGKHRLRLNRIWNKERPLLMVIGLNPSTANADKDDNTITKLIKIARNNSYGGFYMLNLFTFISTDPNKLDKINGNVEFADDNLKGTRNLCDAVLFAWGNFKQILDRDKEVMAMFPNAYALHINANGSPKHPLYCKDDSKLIPFNW